MQVSSQNERVKWLQMPPKAIMTSNSKILTHLTSEQLQQLYKPTAFEMDAPVYIFMGKGTSSQGAQGTSQQLS